MAKLCYTVSQERILSDGGIRLVFYKAFDDKQSALSVFVERIRDDVAVTDKLELVRMTPQPTIWKVCRFNDDGSVADEYIHEAYSAAFKCMSGLMKQWQYDLISIQYVQARPAMEVEEVFIGSGYSQCL